MLLELTTASGAASKLPTRPASRLLYYYTGTGTGTSVVWLGKMLIGTGIPTNLDYKEFQSF